MPAVTISGGMAFVLLALAVPLPVDDTATPLPDHRFDLAALTLARPLARPLAGAAGEPAERLNAPHHDPVVLAGPKWTPPSKTWGNRATGPILQVGALGATDKRVPDLAHIAFDWDF